MIERAKFNSLQETSVLEPFEVSSSPESPSYSPLTPAR